MNIRRSSKRSIDTDDIDDLADFEMDVAGDVDGDGAVEDETEQERRLALVADESNDADATFGSLPQLRHPSLDTASRHVLSRRDLGGVPGRIAVVGPRRGVGVSTVAGSFCQVLHSDFHAPVCHLDLSGEQRDHDGSLAAAIERFRSGDADLVLEAVPGVASLALGAASDDEWYGMIRSDEFARTLRVLDTSFDFLVVELPPLLEDSRGLSAIRFVEAFVTVVRHGTTTLTDVEAVQEELRGRDQLGVILNRYRSRVPKRLGRRLGIR